MFDIKQVKENVFTVIPEFNFDIENIEMVRELREEIDKNISGIENPVVIIDFKEVSYIDSTGLGNIIRIFEMLRKKKGKLIGVNLHVDVEKIFKVTTLDTLIPIYRDVNEALKNI